MSMPLAGGLTIPLVGDDGKIDPDLIPFIEQISGVSIDGSGHLVLQLVDGSSVTGPNLVTALAGNFATAAQLGTTAAGLVAKPSGSTPGYVATVGSDGNSIVYAAAGAGGYDGGTY